jgi:hypothetical protein
MVATLTVTPMGRARSAISGRQHGDGCGGHVRTWTRSFTAVAALVVDGHRYAMPSFDPDASRDAAELVLSEVRTSTRC